MPSGTGGGTGDVQAAAAAAREMKTASSSEAPVCTGLKGSINVIELYALTQRDVHSAGAAGVLNPDELRLLWPARLDFKPC